MVATPAVPGPVFAAQPPVLKTVPVGGVWHRIYETHHTDPLGWGPASSRFSDPTGRTFGVVYLGSSAKVAFVETLLRDAADGRGGACMVELAEIEKRSLARIRIQEVLRLVDLTGDSRLRMGVPSDVVGSSDQTLARQWSVGFHTHPDRPDGVYFLSRLNGEPCIAFYARALEKLEAIATPHLIECDVELAAILDGLAIALI